MYPLIRLTLFLLVVPGANPITFTKINVSGVMHPRKPTNKRLNKLEGSMQNISREVERVQNVANTLATKWEDCDNKVEYVMNSMANDNRAQHKARTTQIVQALAAKMAAKEMREDITVLKAEMSEMKRNYSSIVDKVNSVESQLAALLGEVSKVNVSQQQLAKHCEGVPPITNGFITRIYGSNVGAKVEYACQEHHVMCGSAPATVTCLESEKWEEPDFSCARAHWSNPLDLVNVPMPCGFPVGSTLTVTARPTTTPFGIDFFDKDEDIMFHTAMRTNVNGFVMNAYMRGWGHEALSRQKLAFTLHEPFTIVYVRKDTSMAVYMNGKKQVEFPNRKTTIVLERLRIGGMQTEDIKFHIAT